jgi:hypothetical protein
MLCNVTCLYFVYCYVPETGKKKSFCIHLALDVGHMSTEFLSFLLSCHMANSRKDLNSVSPRVIFHSYSSFDCIWILGPMLGHTDSVAEWLAAGCPHESNSCCPLRLKLWPVWSQAWGLCGCLSTLSLASPPSDGPVLNPSASILTLLKDNG